MKKFKKIFAAILSVYFVFQTCISVFAQNNTHDDVITKMYIKNENGGEIGKLDKWQQFRVYAEFNLPNGKVHENDTTTINVPNELAIGAQSPSFEIKDSKGQVVANALYDSEKNTVKLTYTKYVENHSNISGNLFFYVRVNHKKVKDEKDIELKFTVENKVFTVGTIHFNGIGKPTPYVLRKTGWQIIEKVGRIGYGININETNQEIKNGEFIDTLLSPNFYYLKDTLVIWKGEWGIDENGGIDLVPQTKKDITNSLNVIWNESGTGFTLKFGTLNKGEGIKIMYDVKANYSPADGEIFKNKAILKSNDIVIREQQLENKYQIAGGSAEGYVFKIKIKKVADDGVTPLKGAKFDVIRNANNQKVGAIETNSEGYGEIGGLLKDTYSLYETDAPIGYSKLKDPVVVNVNEFGNDKIVLKNIVNKRELTSVYVEKKWVGPEKEKIEVSVYNEKDENNILEKKEITKADNWTYTFKNLPKYNADGSEAKYKVKEKEIANYESAIIVGPTGAYIITNTNVEKTEVKVEKKWVGPEKEKIEVSVYNEKDENNILEKKEITKADNWTYTFKNLPKYNADGSEAKYKVKEEKVESYKTEIKESEKNSFEITNTNVEEIKIPVEKKWVGEKLEEIVVILSADNKEIKEIKLNDANQWKNEFSNLPKYNKETGKLIQYIIKEKEIEGYITEIQGSVERGFVITNKQVLKEKLPKTAINISENVYLTIFGLFSLMFVVLKRKSEK
ncbi:MAG: Cna B-type domain-containing protein [Parvimonas sp.]|uniref:Cna B-type domain-containing protein n=1 Tax=Parvimonas sp. TaxID=1944660 RepID=UPI0025E9144B|nr:Cna B-type domain-containing protein [Parvimonas sp.]MCI5997617.1 Cna B-type domain-containing protein [Parvimonas sp.]